MEAQNTVNEKTIYHLFGGWILEYAKMKLLAYYWHSGLFVEYLPVVHAENSSVNQRFSRFILELHFSWVRRRITKE